MQSVRKGSVGDKGLDMESRRPRTSVDIMLIR